MSLRRKWTKVAGGLSFQNIEGRSSKGRQGSKKGKEEKKKAVRTTVAAIRGRKHQGEATARRDNREQKQNGGGPDPGAELAVGVELRHLQGEGGRGQRLEAIQIYLKKMEWHVRQ